MQRREFLGLISLLHVLISGPIAAQSLGPENLEWLDGLGGIQAYAEASQKPILAYWPAPAGGPVPRFRPEELADLSREWLFVRLSSEQAPVWDIQIRVLPTLALIDPSGRVLRVWEGALQVRADPGAGPGMLPLESDWFVHPQTGLWYPKGLLKP